MDALFGYRGTHFNFTYNNNNNSNDLKKMENRESFFDVLFNPTIKRMDVFHMRGGVSTWDFVNG